jgi:hypothetical protein
MPFLGKVSTNPGSPKREKLTLRNIRDEMDFTGRDWKYIFSRCVYHLMLIIIRQIHIYLCANSQIISSHLFSKVIFIVQNETKIKGIVFFLLKW